MTKSKDIKVTEGSFEEALGKLDTLYSNLVTEKNNFDSICSDLLEDWEGRASGEGDIVLESIKSKFANCLNNFDVIKRDMRISLNDFANSDISIAEGIEEKTFIPKK